MTPAWPRRLGATPVAAQRTEFVVWAPSCRSVEIEIVHPAPQRITLEPDARHYFSGQAPVGAGARYRVIPDGGEPRPDPASRFQPEGVHGVSEVVAPTYAWSDRAWTGLPLADFIIYELHVGTFTDAGTFDGVRERLDYLAELGITAIEVMPIAQFPGERNWGYDGVLPFAVQNSYGGPEAFKRLVDACHAHGIAVVLDVVYNHLGPEGNYLGDFAPIFTETYKTPWGPAVNVDGAYSDGVRDYFIANALEWIEDYHVDALRLDAVHGILDTSAQPFLAQLTETVHQRARALGRSVSLIAESDLNDVRMIRPAAHGGMGMDAQWLDDFHHSLHTLLTGESDGYYGDYGTLGHFATALRRGYVYAGDFSAYRRRRHGNAPDGTRAEQFVVCSQNHDQVGNRMLGERLAALVDFERLKLAAAAVLLAPYIPLLFMGEEHGESRPFPYFIDHSDEALVEAVRRGRREEFAAFSWQGEPPDPQSTDTFQVAVVDPPVQAEQQAAALLALYQRLIELRKRHRLGPGRTEARSILELPEQQTVVVQRLGSVAVFCFAAEPVTAELPLPRGEWQSAFSTAGAEWLGSGTHWPERVASPGSVRLQLPATSATLFVSTDTDQ